MQIIKKMMAPVSIAGLVWFRILFGCIMMVEVYRYFSKNWVTSLYVQPKFHFKFYGFEWLPDLPGYMFYDIWAALGILSILITIGMFYRISIILFTILFSYVFLMEQANYLNHFYFVCLMSFAMCFIDPHHAFSVDSHNNKSKASNVVPYWQHFLLCFQMGVVYFFGGIAKIDPDWLTGVPLNLWLTEHHMLPYVGQILKSEITPLILSVCGLLLDLLIVPVLLYKRTRLIGFICITGFHVMNHFLFKIGIFPWFSIATTLLFFGPDFPLQFLNKTGLKKIFPVKEAPVVRTFPHSRKVVILLVFFCSYNIVMPLRHHLYQGDVHWHERGHAFSWRMKLRSKGGPTPVFHIKDLDTGKEWKEKATKRLTRYQSNKMKTRPEMIHQYVIYLKRVLKEEGHHNVFIKIDSKVSLNDRQNEPMIKVEYDMASSKECFLCVPEWIQNPKSERSWADSFKRLKHRLAAQDK